MGSEAFARVVFESPLPALNREFEYVVPAELLGLIRFGQRVKVQFAGQAKEGFVVGVSDKAQFTGKLAPIGSIVSEIPVLTENIYELLKAISERQCCSVGELLGNAIPKRAVRVEKKYDFQRKLHDPKKSEMRSAELVPAVANENNGLPKFVERICSIATDYLANDQSVIVCVPDFRDLTRIHEQLLESLPADQILLMDSNALASERYLSFLEQLTGRSGVVLGTRNAIYSPIASDAAIVVWDDGDQSHQDQQAPYLTTREIALLRQSLFEAPLHFLSHSRSAEIQRLVNIGYLSEVETNSWRPKVSVSDSSGLDGMSYKLIKRALENGPVLVQVAAPGNARSLYCAECSARSMCNNCNGPLWLNSKGQIVCRWCGQLNLDFHCSKCRSAKLRQGSAGATRWAEQLGKSFPGIPVREVTATQLNQTIANKPAIVVCTPGIEPVASGGYSGVALLDCAAQLNVDSLRAPEDALRSWFNALGFMRPGGEAVAVGVTPEVSAALTLGEIAKTVSVMLMEREQLGFPPAKRFLSATGSREVIDALNEFLDKDHAFNVLGISQANTVSGDIDCRLVASFKYADGSHVAEVVRGFLGQLGSKQLRTNSKSGKNIRPLSVKFDDPRVI